MAPNMRTWGVEIAQKKGMEMNAWKFGKPYKGSIRNPQSWEWWKVFIDRCFCPSKGTILHVYQDNSYSSLEYEKNIKLEGSQGILQLAVSCDHWVAREMDAIRYISWSIQYHPKRTDAWNSTSTFKWLCRSRWCWQVCPFLVSSVKPFFHGVCRDTQDSHSLQTPHDRCYDTVS